MPDDIRRPRENAADDSMGEGQDDQVVQGSSESEEYDPADPQKQLVNTMKRASKQTKIKLTSMQTSITEVQNRQDAQDVKIQDLQAEIASIKGSPDHRDNLCGRRFQGRCLGRFGGWVQDWSNHERRGEEMLCQHKMDKLIAGIRGFLKSQAPMTDSMIDKTLTKDSNSGREYFGYGRLRLCFKQGTPGKLRWG
eukprot:4185460-Pyramimonas_sp.AAC.1